MRRLWPDLLISWSRVLNGRLRDPLIGRDLLVGCLAGVVIMLATAWPVTTQLRIDPETITSGSAAIVTLLQGHQTALIFGLYNLAFLFILRVTLRHILLAGFVFMMAYVSSTAIRDPPRQIYLSNTAWAALLVFLYVRFGLVSVIAAWFTVMALLRFPFTTDLSAWYASGGILAIVSVLLVAGYGFYTSTLAGRGLLLAEE